MRRLAVALLITGLGLTTSRVARACPGCSNPNLPTARAGNFALLPGEISVALNLTGTTMRVVHSEYCPDIGPICGRRAEPPQLHDQRFYIGELRPVAGIGITKLFAVEVQAPIRLLKTTIVFRRLDGSPFEPDYANIHHRNETLFGIADPWILGRATWSVDHFIVTGRGGVGVPLGSTEEDPFARGRAGLSHQHIQFGTGTFYPVLAVDAGVRLGDFGLSAYAQTLLFLTDNKYGYQAGNRYVGGFSGDMELLPRLRGGVGADILNEQPERWGGVVQQDGNVGRTDVLAGGMVSYAFGNVIASLAVKIPIYQHFIDVSHGRPEQRGQLTYPAIVNLAVQTTFGGGPAILPLSPPVQSTQGSRPEPARVVTR
jgi:hypothetical protein